MPGYLFDAKLCSALRVFAPDEATARAWLGEALNCGDVVVHLPNGTPVCGEVSLDGELVLADVDGAAVSDTEATAPLPRRTAIFVRLCDIADAFDHYVRDLPSGPERDRLEVLVLELDQIIDRTIGVEGAWRPPQKGDTHANPRP
jgi:hypothetical protein